MRTTDSVTYTKQEREAIAASRVKYPDIAFIGPAGSGKTTAAQYLVDYHGYTRLSFAYALKLISRILWQDGYGREELQKLGVAVREIHDDTWVKHVLRRIENREEGEHFVIDDCRFPNEYEMLRGEGFRFVRLFVDRTEQIGRLTANGRWQNEKQLSHISETALNDFPEDKYIETTGFTTTDLYEEVVALLDRWVQR